ncbi:2,5-diketo-D-gluconate reductase A [Franzmannia pantelleriensis]|uniref:2,5-diketo-D-gluconate reductase A n=1 Tax=Franzmannia pantelleriensis TaxID=48727 RepID=A0A1G9P9C3_9GAMM|nr:aldo/keto reductase [Halomonas pantelleriensis]SDL95294.1 2,5-diketo-D-gluconate reductase A [Halomonas pantelleriensis]
MSMTYLPAVHADVKIPALGYGLWQVPPEQSAELVSRALQTGYRLLDTAEAYYNEQGVGKGIRDSGVAREEIFVSTKVWNTHHGYAQTLQAFDASQRRLDLDRIDLYLMHWPSRIRDAYVETWQAMIRLRDEGRVGAIGVCNFSSGQLQRLIGETGVTPVVNQVELHPYFQQQKLREFHREQGVITQSWSPLGLWWQNPDPGSSVLQAPEILELSERYGKTPAQIVLRWHLDSGLATISKSVRPERIVENFQLFDFALTPREIKDLAGLDRRDGRLGPDPETADF